jgi:hypothetical protein
MGANNKRLILDSEDLIVNIPIWPNEDTLTHPFRFIFATIQRYMPTYGIDALALRHTTTAATPPYLPVVLLPSSPYLPYCYHTAAYGLPPCATLGPGIRIG